MKHLRYHDRVLIEFEILLNVKDFYAREARLFSKNTSKGVF